MKFLLVGINSKFIHTNLAIRYLKEVSREETSFLEFTINQPLDTIYGALLEEEAQVYGFSTYIWNIQECLDLARDLKAVRPQARIVFGGPEVSYESETFLQDHPYVDEILRGEGERAWPIYQEKISRGGDLKDVPNLVYRQGDQICQNPLAPYLDLKDLPDPYLEKEDLTNKIAYLESSRGCPFHCAFCLSSVLGPVRFVDMDRIFSQIQRLLSYGAVQIKFIDRTFNASEKRAFALMDFIQALKLKDFNFHFEATAHLMSEKMIDYFSKSPRGLFQLELGIQSTNEKTLKAINRTMDWPRLKEVVEKIRNQGRTHQHVDLIIGLPYEGLDQFKKSFNDTYSLGAEKIQVGFLKVLKGSLLKNKAQDYGLVYSLRPPYEILETPWLSALEIRQLKVFEDLVDKFHNEGYFKRSNSHLMKKLDQDPFSYFYNFSLYYKKEGLHLDQHQRKKLYQILTSYAQFLGQGDSDFYRALFLDYVQNNQGPLPDYFPQRQEAYMEKSKIHDLFRQSRVQDLLGVQDPHIKDLMKKVHPYQLDGKIILVDRRDNPVKIYEMEEIDD